MVSPKLEKALETLYYPKGGYYTLKLPFPYPLVKVSENELSDARVEARLKIIREMRDKPSPSKKRKSGAST